MDFKLTKDGDLLLGQQATDEEGYLLYYIIDSQSPTLPITTRNINEASVAVHDIRTVHDDEERLQLIQSRLRTDNPDWYLYDEVGASLSDFIGEENSPETASEIESRIIETLIRNDAFTLEELEVNVVPTSINEILVDIILDSENRYLRYAFSLDFDIGINNTYILDRDGNILEEDLEVNPDIYEGIPKYETEISEEELEELENLENEEVGEGD